MKRIFLTIAFFLTAFLVNAQVNPLMRPDGSVIRSVEEWEQYRPELLELFRTEMYGHAPTDLSRIHYEMFDCDTSALNGKATRIQVRMFWELKNSQRYTDMLVYLPNIKDNNGFVRVPVLVGLNFQGNHSVNADPGIHLTDAYIEGPGFFFKNNGIVDNKATEDARGNNANHWPIEQILDRGFGIATAYRGEISADEKGTVDGVQNVYPELKDREDNWATIATWAWTLSRMADWLVTNERVDTSKLCVFGFSRLGKTAVWAAANDQRFSALISQESGSGGVKLFRSGIGEDIQRLCTVFPHWYCKNFRKYMGHDTELPFDQNQVLSLVAPRAIYVSSATDDNYSYPKGEFEGLKAAAPVYALYGTENILPDNQPEECRPVGIGTSLGYHVRPGGHDVKTYDWDCYLLFLQSLWK